MIVKSNIKNQRLKMFLVSIISALLLLCSFTPTLAQTPSPEATSPANIREEIKERVKERIEQIQTEFKKRAFWGTLKEISNSTLVLKTPRGEKRVKTTEETKFVGPGQKQIKFQDLEIGNFIIAMGFWQENGTLTAKRVIVLSKPPKPTIKRQAVYGKVVDVSKEEKLLSLTNLIKNDITYEVGATGATIITKMVEGKIKKMDFSAISLGDRVVAVGVKEEESETLTAKLIHVIPGKAEGIEKKLSPAPTEGPTPTPTKKPTPTPTPED